MLKQKNSRIRRNTFPLHFLYTVLNASVLEQTDRQCSWFCLLELAQRDSSCSQLDCKQHTADHVKSMAPPDEGQQP